MVLLDITMPPEDGIKTARRLKEKQPELIVLFLTMHEDESLLHEALRVGAAGYVIKRAEESEIPARRSRWRATATSTCTRR
jgi:DNA-binding NarL/FixJ family response regulator